MPALFALMDKALEAGVLFQEIENELDKLIDIEADQDNCRRTPEKKDAIDCELSR